MSNGVPAGSAPPPGGRVLTSTRGTAFLGCAAVVVPVVLLVAILIALNGGIVATLFAIVFVGLTAAAVVLGANEYRKWDDLEFVVPQWPLPMGSEMDAELVQRAKISVPDRDIPISGILLCREKVIYQVGTDTRTERNDVHRTPFNAMGTVRDGVFRTTIPVHIPLHSGAPTIDFEHNEIRWRVELDLEGLSRLHTKQSFELVVAPQLSGRSGVIQDSPRP